MRTFLALLLLAGCKGGSSSALPPPKMDTPRATADSLVAAIKARNVDAVGALMPSAEQIGKYLDCDPKLKERAEKAVKDVPEGQTPEIGGFDKFGSGDETLRAGQDLDGCKVKASFTVHRSKTEIHLLHDAKTEFRDVLLIFAQLPDDPKWYYLR